VDEFEDFPVLFHPLTGETMGLNETGLRVWRLIDDARTVGDIINRISRLFDLAGDPPVEDVEKFISRLHRRMYISWAQEGNCEDE